jgi:hypothetical protein
MDEFGRDMLLQALMQVCPVESSRLMTAKGDVDKVVLADDAVGFPMPAVSGPQ